MKRERITIFLLWMVCMMFAIITLGQNQKQNLLQEIKCTPPRFTGIKGTVPILTEEKFQTIESYLMKQIEYPENDLTYLRQGTEVVSFVVAPTGDLSDFHVINSLSSQIDDQVINALKSTNGMWKPGFNDDKAVAMDKEISIVFKISDIGLNDFQVLARKYYAHGSALLFTKSNPKKALRTLERGVTLLPSDKGLLVLRGLTRYELGNKEGALKDWTRVKTLGGFESEGYLENFENMKGYAEMTQILEK